MLARFIDTLKNTVNHPSNVIDPFIQEQESRFMHPFKFCLIGILLVVTFNSFLVDFTIEPTLDMEVGDNEQMQNAAVWMEATNIRLLTQFLPIGLLFILVPAIAIGGNFFLKSKMDGFYSHIILNSYAIGVAIISLLVLIPIWIFLNIPLTDTFMHSSLPGFLVAVVVVWVQKTYFMARSFLDWIRILSSFVIGYVIFSLLMNLTGGILGFISFSISQIVEALG
ncbi:MAG: hypothetical protein WEA58_05885 [Balneolaceae bacterium]